MATIQVSHGAHYARLMSTGAFRGSRVVDNAEMCTMIDSSDEWIQQRTGIAQRHWATDEETPRSMAVAACRQAVERSGLDITQIDALILATVSNSQQMPSLASYVAADLGCASPAIFDISAACAGFCYGLTLADSLIRTGSATHVLVVGVEKLSETLDHADRGTAFLFSDGAGAVVVGPSDEPAIGPTVWGSDPQQADVLTIDSWRSLPADQQHPFIRMDGTKVFRWATTFIADKTRETLRAAGLQAEDLEVFIPHQANNRITDSMLRHLKLPKDIVVARDIAQMGNSSAASVPLALDAVLQSGEAHRGQTALLIGFGAGLTFAGQVVRLP
ncbi:MULTISPECIES: beta-ketoacyl-ACP synthase III [unclassified Luteococcus]|uniref:beta-ketoacyl-ACP synthase III n=1 Tax=unclassified Luteococcus TaxID=2639923 RepID=UPI00313B3EB4